MITQPQQVGRIMVWKSARRQSSRWGRWPLARREYCSSGTTWGAAIFAIDVGDSDAGGGSHAVSVDNFDTALASYLGCNREDVTIRDMAVHPVSDNLYFSVMRGQRGRRRSGANQGLRRRGHQRRVPGGSGLLPIRHHGRGRCGRPAPGYPAKVADGDGDRYVLRGRAAAGGRTSNEEFSSTLRRIPFPFNGEAESNSLEIFHVSHGQYETAAPIRAFVPYQGNASILASYTCTPVVHFPGRFRAGQAG